MEDSSKLVGSGRHDLAARVAAGFLAAYPRGQQAQDEARIVHWLAYYIDFIVTFPWKTMALRPTAIFEGGLVVQSRTNVPFSMRGHFGNNIVVIITCL